MFIFIFLSNGPTEPRRKPNEYSSPILNNLSWLPTHTNSSMLSSPDESPSTHHSPIMNEQIHGRKIQQNLQQQSQQSSYPKTICRHCKSHNMPECLYTCKFLPPSPSQLFLFSSNSSYHVR